MDNQDESEKYGIWYPYEVFYIESMLSITRTAMTNQTMLRIELENASGGKPLNDDIVLDSAQNLLQNAAALSRYFWLSRPKEAATQRSERLREAFSIDEANPLNNRSVRNYLEHFDERLDKFLSNQVAGTILPRYVGKRLDKPLRHFFRAYYVDQWTFRVLDAEINIRPIIDELIRIHLLLEKYNHEGGRLPRGNRRPPETE